MVDVAEYYGQLSLYIDELGAKFVDKFIPADPNVTPEAYAHDVKAYCVLCHAAFEEFIEEVVLTVANKAVNDWKTVRKSSDVITALLCWHHAKLDIDTDEDAAEKKPFDYLRLLIDAAKKAFSDEVHNNHGASVIYLRKMLLPVAMEVPSNSNRLNSLRKLAEGRGTYAHRGRTKVVLAPEDAKAYVGDVLELCERVRDIALSKL